MIHAPRDLTAVMRLDLAESLRSRWLLLCVGLYAVLGAIFVLVGLRESSLLGFTGMGRVLLSACHAMLLLIPLLALTATVQVINRARDDGTLEFLFSQPIRRGAYFLAVSLSRYATLALPLVILLALMGLFAQVVFHQPIPWVMLGRAMAICATLMLAFTGIGLFVSTFVRSQAKAVTWSVIAWMAGVAILDFGLISLMLEWQVNARLVFVLAVLNPVQAARMALLSAAEPELSVLGPVGFYLTNRLGPTLLFALGTLGPALVGILAWWLALRRFSRGDVV